MPTAIAGLLFIGYALISLTWAPEINWFAMANFLALVGAFGIGFVVNQQKVWLWIVSGMMVLIPAYLIIGLLNPNYAGAAIAISLAGALVYNWYSFVPFAATGLILAQSRGALLAGGTVLFARYCFRFPLSSILVVVLTLTLVLTQKPLVDGSLFQRLGIWQDTLNHLTLFGNGLGTFPAAFAAWPIHTNMTLVLAPHAYNDALELIFELGVGVIPLWVLILCCLESKASKLPLLAFAALSLTHFPLFIPPVGQLFAMTLGHMARKD